MKIFLMILFFVSLHGFANERIDSIAFGTQITGDTNVWLDLNEFKPIIEFEKKANVPEVKAQIVDKSLQWIRSSENILLPRARVQIAIKANAEEVTALYDDHVLHFQSNQEGSYTEFFYSLFQSNEIQILYKKQKIAKITFKMDAMASKAPAHRRAHIDYTCNNSQIQFSKMDGEFYSVQCKTIRVGDIGSEEPMLEVTWIAMNFQMKAPVTTVFRDSNAVKVTLQSDEHYEKVIEIFASVPKRINRMKFAGGIGPYIFESHLKAESKTEFAPSAMLYGNFTLGDTTSIRGFEALVTQNPATKAYFNNFGIYFAYDLARLLDNRVQLMALLGGQGLTFAYNGVSGETFSQALFPQGFELTYFNAFGIRGNNAGFGMFVFPSSNNPYKNMWIRYGKRVFYELNYISWELSERKASMFGISVGFPLAGFF